MDRIEEAGEVAAAAATGFGLLATLKRLIGRNGNKPPSGTEIMGAIDGLRHELGDFKEEVREQFRQVHERLLTQEWR